MIPQNMVLWHAECFDNWKASTISLTTKVSLWPFPHLFSPWYSFLKPRRDSSLEFPYLRKLKHNCLKTPSLGISSKNQDHQALETRRDSESSPCPDGLFIYSSKSSSKRLSGGLYLQNKTTFVPVSSDSTFPEHLPPAFGVRSSSVMISCPSKDHLHFPSLPPLGKGKWTSAGHWVSGWSLCACPLCTLINLLVFFLC